MGERKQQALLKGGDDGQEADLALTSFECQFMRSLLPGEGFSCAGDRTGAVRRLERPLAARSTGASIRRRTRQRGAAQW
jgi:hypothetical protein